MAESSVFDGVNWGSIITGVAGVAGQLMQNNAAKNAAKSTTAIDSSASETSTGSESIVKGTDLSQGGLGQIITQLLGKISGGADPQFSREQAILNSKDSAQMALNQVLEAGVPVAEARQMASGAYGSTTIDRMNKDTAARGQAAYGSVVQNSILQYAQLQQQQEAQQMQQLMGAIQLTQDSNVNATKTSTSNRTGATETPTFQNGAAPNNTAIFTNLLSQMAKDGLFNTDEENAKKKKTEETK